MKYYYLSGLWLISLVIVFELGYFIRTIINKLKTLENGLQEFATVKLKKEKQQPRSSFIDPTDPATIARLDHEEKLRLLNPEE